MLDRVLLHRLPRRYRHVPAMSPVPNVQDPKVDLISARSHALQRCKAWGYNKVEPFDGVEKICLQPSLFDCHYTRVILRYQCEN